MNNKILSVIRSTLVCLVLPGLALSLTTVVFAQGVGFPSEEVLSRDRKSVV
jgi:hypothetical protein